MEQISFDPILLENLLINLSDYFVRKDQNNPINLIKSSSSTPSSNSLLSSLSSLSPNEKSFFQDYHLANPYIIALYWNLVDQYPSLEPKGIIHQDDKLYIRYNGLVHLLLLYLHKQSLIENNLIKLDGFLWDLLGYDFTEEMIQEGKIIQLNPRTPSGFQVDPIRDLNQVDPIRGLDPINIYFCHINLYKYARP